jgi:hypothetical protein
MARATTALKSLRHSEEISNTGLQDLTHRRRCETLIAPLRDALNQGRVITGGKDANEIEDNALRNLSAPAPRCDAAASRFKNLNRVTAKSTAPISAATVGAAHKIGEFMIGRKSVIGIAVLCALVLSAFAAASASAEQRAYACSESFTPREYSDAHCVNKVSEGAKFGVKEEPTGTAVTISATNAKTASSTEKASPATLRGTLAGVKTEITCTTVTGTGTLTNAAASTSGSGTLNYTGCTVVEPAGKGCQVGNVTATVKATTVGQAANRLKFEPSVTGGNFATVGISGCANEAPPAASYPVTGSLVATTEGATTSTTLTEVETENKLKFGGNKAGLEGKITISATSSSVGPLILK